MYSGQDWARMKAHLALFLILMVSMFPVEFAVGGVSEPYGGMLVPIRGGEAINLICSGGFTRKTDYQGVGDIPEGGFLDDPDAGWETDCFTDSHYLLLSTGEWTGIRSNTGTRLYLESSLCPSSMVEFRIIPFNTLSSMFGEDNSAGFCGGQNMAESDILILWDARAHQYSGYYYFNTLRDRWEDMNNNPAGGALVYPDESLIVVGKADGEILLHGMVQLGSTSGYLCGDGGTSIIPNPYPVDIRIQASGLEKSLEGASTFAGADWLLDWNSQTQAYGNFYYFDTVDQLWRDLDNNPAGEDAVIRTGEAMVVIKNSHGDVRWTMEQPFELK